MKTILTIVAGLAMSCTLTAQTIRPQVYGSSGTVSSSTNAQLSWTLGECLVASRSAGPNQVTEGYQQARYFITAIDLQASEIDISVYPNPTADVLTLDFAETVTDGYRIELVGITGQILREQHLDPGTNSIRISLREVADGSYFLRVTDLTKHSQRSFQVRKIQ